MHEGIENAEFQRAELLVGQGRYDLAESHLRRALAGDPDHAVAHLYLALCLSERGACTEATDEAERGVGLAPDSGYSHFVLSQVLGERHLTEREEEEARRAVELDPWDARFWGRLGAALSGQKKYAGALEAADRGLEADAENRLCLNIRALALRGMGRHAEAGATLEGALEREPESAMAHANMGWSCLHEGQSERALTHFTEALRLNPSMEWARQGMVEAMKARYLVYRVFLKYALWMSRLTSSRQWGVMLGGYIGYQALRMASNANPGLRPYVFPLMVAYIVLVLASWLATPLSNMLLSLNRFGRMALGADQKLWAYLLGAAVGLALVLVGVGAWTGSSDVWLLALYAGVLVVPVACAGAARAGRGRIAGAVLAGALACLGVVVAVWPAVGTDVIVAYIWGCLLTPLVVNLINTSRPAVRR